jgi:hypothetical protein
LLVDGKRISVYVTIKVDEEKVKAEKDAISLSKATEKCLKEVIESTIKDI